VWSFYAPGLTKSPISTLSIPTTQPLRTVVEAIAQQVQRFFDEKQVSLGMVPSGYMKRGKLCTAMFSGPPKPSTPDCKGCDDYLCDGSCYREGFDLPAIEED